MKLKIKLCLTITVSLLVISFPVQVFAQTAVSNCFVTKVGGAVGDPVLPPNCQTSTSSGGTGVSGSCGTAVDWDQKINDNLENTGRKFDKLANPVTSGCGTTIPPASWADGVYWCTYSVIDAYKLAGIDGLTPGNSGFVVYMPQVFTSTPGLKYVQYESADHQAALKQVGPGFAMIMATPDDNNAHVALVKTIQIDERGNGTIISLESNSSAKSHTYTIANWVIEPISWPIRGFGGK